MRVRAYVGVSVERWEVGRWAGSAPRCPRTQDTKVFHVQPPSPFLLIQASNALRPPIPSPCSCRHLTLSILPMGCKCVFVPLHVALHLVLHQRVSSQTVSFSRPAITLPAGIFALTRSCGSRSSKPILLQRGGCLRPRISATTSKARQAMPVECAESVPLAHWLSDPRYPQKRFNSI